MTTTAMENCPSFPEKSIRLKIVMVMWVFLKVIFMSGYLGQKTTVWYVIKDHEYN